MPHLLGDERKITARNQTPAGVGVAGLVGAARADACTALDVAPFCVPGCRHEPFVDLFTAGLHQWRQQWGDGFPAGFVSGEQDGDLLGWNAVVGGQ